MASKPDTWMPLYIADYLRKTMHLTREQHGGYMLLLMACWDRGGRLPNDAAQLAGIVRATPAEWRKLAPVLLPYFEVDGDDLIQGRVIEEHEKAARLSEARSHAGKKGGRPKRSGNEENPESKPKANGFANGKQNETPARVRSLPSPESHPSDVSPYSPPEGDDDQSDQIEEAYRGWNELASRLGLPVASGLDAARRRLIAKRLDEGGLDGWREALAGVERSAFLRGLRPGADGRTMRADLGFVAAAKNYPRLREGFYGDDAPKPEAKRVVPDWQGPPDVWRAVHFADPRCAVGFLAHTTWRDVPERAVVTDSRVIADRLRRDVSHVLKDLKVSIILERKEVA